MPYTKARARDTTAVAAIILYLCFLPAPILGADETSIVIENVDLSAHIQQAEYYASIGEHDKAAAEWEYVLTERLKRNPLDTWSLEMLGDLRFSQGQRDGAINAYNQLISIDPRHEKALYNTGYLYYADHQREQAVQTLRQLLRVNPHHADALNTLGYILIEEPSSRSDGIALIEQAVSIDPENAAYLDSLGWAYYTQNKPKKAIKYLLQANHRLQDPEIHNHLGEAYQALKKLDKAREHWSRSLELNPDQPEIRGKLHDRNIYEF